MTLSINSSAWGWKYLSSNMWKHPPLHQHPITCFLEYLEHFRRTDLWLHPEAPCLAAVFRLLSRTWKLWRHYRNCLRRGKHEESGCVKQLLIISFAVMFGPVPAHTSPPDCDWLNHLSLLLPPRMDSDFSPPWAFLITYDKEESRQKRLNQPVSLVLPLSPIRRVLITSW